MTPLIAFYALAALGVWYFGYTRPRTRRHAFAWMVLAFVVLGAGGALIELVTTGSIGAPPGID